MYCNVILPPPLTLLIIFKIFMKEKKVNFTEQTLGKDAVLHVIFFFI